ncbi:uncharacterized protein LOC121366118, partial [Gigantopelta aegis]|uniref:uncharacterized protein LOC121366118 n=1 Tax=Gigantopelta aegis TaxID=1735272 RepID=UPI001B88DFE4
MTDEKKNRVREIMTTTITKLLAGELIRVQEYTDMCVKSVQQTDAEDDYQQIGYNLEYMEDDLMELFKGKHPLVTPLFAEPPQPNRNHQQAIDRCYNSFVNDLDLKSTSFLDHLVQDDLLSVASVESIQTRATTRARNEAFMHILKTCTSGKINNVIIPALQKTHLHLAEKLKAEMAKPCQIVPSKCLACQIREDVQVKRLADSLHQQKSIPHTDYKTSAMTNTDKWTALIKEVNTAEIIKALQKNYPDLHAECQIKKLKTLECTCFMEDEENEMDVSRISDLESIMDVVEDYAKQLAKRESELLNAFWKGKTYGKKFNLSSEYDDSIGHDSDLTDMCSPK